MKKYFSISLFLIFTLCYGYDGTNSNTMPQKILLNQGHALKGQVIPGYNQSAMIEVNAWDFLIGASFIYWQAIEDGLDLGHIYPLVQNENNIGHNIKMNFQYKPGFKVSLGMSLYHDNWLLFAEYTWLYLTDIKNVHTSISNNIAESWNYDSLNYDIYASWNFRYNMVDLVMLRPCYIGTHLIAKPFTGFRGGWMNQHYTAATLTTDIIYAQNKENTWLIGPCAGVNCDWLFFDAFRIIGNSSIALIYQHFNTNATNVISLTEESQQFTPNLQGAIGLGWGTYLGNNNCWHFDMSALYELTYFFNQNKMMSLNQKITQSNLVEEISGYAYSPHYANANLMLHGLTFSLRFDF